MFSAAFPSGMSLRSILAGDADRMGSGFAGPPPLGAVFLTKSVYKNWRMFPVLQLKKGP